VPVLLSVPERAREFWESFVKDVRPNLEGRSVDVWPFGDGPDLAEELASLVMAGYKSATAGLAWEYEAEGVPLPAPGDLNVITTWDGEPRCVVETLEVSVTPFDQVDELFAADEGEGDLSLRYWREAHWSFFSRTCERIGRTPCDDMPVVCQRFRLVYPRR
jgi:uncharacterized protein YhfF